MCGIAGFAGEGDGEVLTRMGETLVHRGPDDRGMYEEPGRVGLYFRRLAIIDLKTGNQPSSNEDGTIRSVFNGEIYNYLDLKQRHLSRHVFKGTGDAEILPHLYEEMGTDMFGRLNGMFAVALWDSKNDRLVLARDRFGKKPLYYALSGSTLVFGSELKALLRHPKVPKRLNFAALSLYLNHEYVPAPYSIFEGIFKLMPGTFAVFSRGNLRAEEYYSPRFRKETIPDNLEAVMERLDALLDGAVKDRLIADVPLGAFLSGGLDSSTVCYYAARGMTSRLRTFGIGFEEKSFDESAHSRRVAAHLGTEHHERRVSGRDLLEVIPKVVALLDEPTGDAALFPNYLLSRFAGESVKSVLGGDGGDELFMGYPTFQAHKLAVWYARVPESVRRTFIEPVIRRLPASFGYIPLDYRLKRFVAGFAFPPEHRDLVWIGSFSPEERKAVLTKAAADEARDDFEVVDRVTAEVAGEAPLHKIAYQYLKTYLIDDVICMKDRASMYNSLELRAPFLDFRVVDFVNSLPPQIKLKGWTGKYVLKKLMAKRLPRGVVHRAKKGFGVPIAKWLCGELRGLLTDMLGADRLGREGIFNPVYVRQLMDEHIEGARDNRKPLWTLLMFQLWRERWL